jgi:hypothetical protein
MSNKQVGRPESFDALYFSHSVHETDELKVMVMKYGSDGYMGYFRLFECVAKADYHRIELKNETQKQIFLIRMGVSQEIIDFLFDLLLQTGSMNAEQWENNQTIYLDKFVRQFKKLWYDRYKSIPDANGNYIDRSPQKEKDIRVSRTGNGDSIVGIVSNNNTIESKGRMVPPPLLILIPLLLITPIWMLISHTININHTIKTNRRRVFGRGWIKTRLMDSIKRKLCSDLAKQGVL